MGGDWEEARRKFDIVDKDFLKVLLPLEEMAKDLGESAYKVVHGIHDRTAKEKESVVAVQVTRMT